MSSIETKRRQNEMFAYILEFAERSPGLEVSFMPRLPGPLMRAPSFEEGFSENAGETIQIRQKIDGKVLRVDASWINGMLPRFDQDGQEFVQVNFEAGHKILITKNLIGFKPVLLSGLEKSGLPSVVTTPDILNVLDAIHEATAEIDSSSADIKSLKRVFEAVVLGGELVGFDLSVERTWLKQFPSHPPKVSA